MRQEGKNRVAGRLAVAALVGAAFVTTAPSALAQERASVVSIGVDAKSELEVVEFLAQPPSRELGEGVRAALAKYGPWARERGYVGHLSPDQSVVYFSLARRSAGSETEWIAEVEETLSELLPDPRTRHRGPITETGGPTTRQYPIGGDVPVWKHDLEPVDTHCGVLFELDRDAHLAELEELAGGATRHLGEPGRSILTDEVGAWVWRVGSVPDAHQVVQGAAQFVLERRFPHLPAWLRDGVAWHAELAVLGSVRCLTGSAGESSRDFASDWATDQRIRPFCGDLTDRMEVLAAYEPGDDYLRGAAMAFDTVERMIDRDTQSLANAAEELRLYWEDHSVRHDARLGWQRDADYRVPVHVQSRICLPLLEARGLAGTADVPTRGRTKGNAESGD